MLGDDIDTDVIVPGRYMKFAIEEIARHCLEPVLPSFANEVKKGDFVVAGRNFGAGSSREQAPAALRQLGVAALIAPSFAGIFYRNSLNVGLPALVCSRAGRSGMATPSRWTTPASEIANLASGERLPFEPIPDHLLEMVRDGGLLAHLEKRLRKEHAP